MTTCDDIEMAARASAALQRAIEAVEVMERVCEDLEEALHTAEVHSRPRPWPFNHIPYCRFCGALGRKNSQGEPRAVDDGILHDPDCVLVVLPAVIDDLKKVAGL
jgi:hypothetical protein